MAKPLPLNSEQPNLAELQRLIANSVMRPLASGDRSHRANAEVAAQLIKPNDRLDSFERLQLYNQQYWWRILGSFREDFRGLRAVLGERKFERLAVAYLEACGSSSWSLRDLGRGLEGFLREHPELIAPHGALAIDVVRVEWARIIAFDGPEKPPLDATKLTGVAPEHLRLELQPHLTLLEVAHPVDKLLGRLRLAHSEANTASNAVAASQSRRAPRLGAKRSPRPIHLAVHRVDFAVYYKRLDPEAYRLLSALRAGASLADACQTAFADSNAPSETAAATIQQWFATWMRFGWLTN
jgi:hypothetical protein